MRLGVAADKAFYTDTSGSGHLKPTWLQNKFACNSPANVSSDKTYFSQYSRASLFATANYNVVAFNGNIKIENSWSVLPRFLCFQTKCSWDGAPRDCGLLPDNVGLNSSFRRTLRGGMAVFFSTTCNTGGLMTSISNLMLKHGKSGVPKQWFADL